MRNEGHKCLGEHSVMGIGNFCSLSCIKNKQTNKKEPCGTSKQEYFSVPCQPLCLYHSSLFEFLSSHPISTHGNSTSFPVLNQMGLSP